MIKVTVWNEYLHETMYEGIAKVYPTGIHGCIAEFLQSVDIEVRTATLNEPQHGLTEEVLSSTDVLIWWGHAAHDKVEDEVVERVCRHIHGGMGFIALHSAHHSKVMKRLLGTTLNLKWRHGDREILWNICPSHPITAGIPDHIELPQEEMYGEPFDIPVPDETLFLGWFSGGEVFRSGVTYRRGNGRIFYFQPGHEEYPIYRNPHIQQVIRNAVHWAYNPLCTSHAAIQVENSQPINAAD